MPRTCSCGARQIGSTGRWACGHERPCPGCNEASPYSGFCLSCLRVVNRILGVNRPRVEVPWFILGMFVSSIVTAFLAWQLT